MSVQLVHLAAILFMAGVMVPLRSDTHIAR